MTARKHSKKRDAILECIRSTGSHPSADWVYAQLKPELPDLSLGTVYRNLAAFKQEGVIASVGTVDGAERYDWRTFPHPHFICTHCGAVLDVDEIDPPQELAKRVKCGSVRDCVLTFYGICNQCVCVDAQNTSNQTMEEQL
ncbi:MAG: transcriptional repressor [Oscillospiraceae bacterium]|nr:transcriptional repressor [Oscillospiraceae bacterium]